MAYTERFERALVYAHELHREQERKGSGAPYVTHLLAVASLVGENGGSEDQVIAALLHDAIEDCHEQLADIRGGIEERFGADVLAIVEACTDADTTPKPPWQARKEAYLDRLREKDPADPSFLVAKADKLHNLRSIVRDFDLLGDELWGRFRGGRDGTLWYYEQLATIFAASSPGPMEQEIGRQVVALRMAVAQADR